MIQGTELRDHDSGRWFTFKPSEWALISAKRTGRVIPYVKNDRVNVYESEPLSGLKAGRYYVLYETPADFTLFDKSNERVNARSITKDVALQLMDVDLIPTEELDSTTQGIEAGIFSKVY